MRIWSLRSSIGFQPSTSKLSFKTQEPEWVLAQIEAGKTKTGDFWVLNVHQISAPWLATLLKSPAFANLEIHIWLQSNSVSHSKVVWEELLTFFVEMQAAGGVVQATDQSILLIFRKGFWDLPKGKLEKGEDLKTCALREVEEETGLSGHKATMRLSDTFHVYEEKGKFIFKTTAWWLMEAEKNQNLIPQTQEQIEKVEWCMPEQFVEKDFYPLIKSLLKEALVEIKKL